MSPWSTPSKQAQLPARDDCPKTEILSCDLGAWIPLGEPWPHRIFLRGSRVKTRYTPCHWLACNLCFSHEDLLVMPNHSWSFFPLWLWMWYSKLWNTLWIFLSGWLNECIYMWLYTYLCKVDLFFLQVFVVCLFVGRSRFSGPLGSWKSDHA